LAFLCASDDEALMTASVRVKKHKNNNNAPMASATNRRPFFFFPFPLSGAGIKPTTPKHAYVCKL
jgi:hypothetical protein